MRWLPTLASCALLALCSGCSGRLAAPASSQPAAPAHPAAQPPRITFVSPSILLPDVPSNAETAGLEPDGSRRVVLAQMRILERPDGAIERAPSLLPGSVARMLSLELPSRLGGGFLFVASSESSAQLWRAPTWLAPLEPLLSTSQGVHGLLAGFDRVYLRHGRIGAIYGIDPDTGTYTDSGRLPLPLRIGSAHFADGWRAVVVTDLRGPLATFDAGASWTPLDVGSPVLSLEAAGDDIRIATRNGTLLLSPDGVLTSAVPAKLSTDTSRPPSAAAPYPTSPFATPPYAPPGYRPPAPYYPGYRDPAVPYTPAVPAKPYRPLGEHPLGPRPLRVALERGYPISSSRALVAHAGHLAVVDLSAGSIVELHRNVYPDSYSSCNAFPLEQGVGFVCGESHGATTVFRWDPPARLSRVMHWDHPRAVFPAGNGAFVARAPCPGLPAHDASSQYCVRSPTGRTRELRFQGDVGAERVVPLSDGRVAVVVAPRPGAEGRLVLLDGQKSSAYVLDLRALPRSVSDLVRRGTWLHGVQELEPGVLGAWVEAGGPVVGLRISLLGRVTAGPVHKSGSDSTSVIVSGRFGLVWRRLGHGLETTDGGATWNEIDLPQTLLPTSPDQRSCSAIGCLIGGWMRVGWGEQRLAHDLESPKRPPSKTLAQIGATTSFFDCDPTGRSSPPPAPASKPPPVPTPTAYGAIRHGPGMSPYPYPYAHAAYNAWQRWLPFGPAPAPTLSPNEEGLSASSRDFGDPRPGYRVYVWGPKSSDWTRSGRWQIRFDDPFDPVGHPRSTATAPSPWSDLTSAASVLNIRSDIVLFDAETRAGILGWCLGSRQCRYFSIAPREPPVALFTSDPAGLPNIASAVRTEDGWLLLTPNIGQVSELWSVSLSGQAKRIRSLHREQANYGDAVALVRRARSPQIGIFATSPAPGRASADWLVLPIDPASGRLAEPVRVGTGDLDGLPPPPCAPEQDGWLLEPPWSPSPSLSLPGRPFVSDIRARFRADPGRICLDALAGRARRPEDQPPAAATPTPRPATGVRLSLWDSDRGRKLEYLCRPRSTSSSRSQTTVAR